MEDVSGDALLLSEGSYLVLLVGTRSSIVVEYEETCQRCAVAIEAAVSFHKSPRLMDLSKSVSDLAFDPAQVASGFVPCAFAPDRRKFYYDWALKMGLTPAEPLIDPFAVVASSVRIGDASYINAGAVVGALSMSGEGVLINRNASVGHHCLLGDFVSIGPGATLASNIQVAAGAVIGAGATVLPNVRIGAGAVISGGTLVRSDIADNMLVHGFPAKQRKHNKARSTLSIRDEE